MKDKNLVIRAVKIPGREGTWDVKVENGLISRISREEDGEEVIHGGGKYLIPGLVNTHTHAAMVLFRGYADDLPLDKWLREEIWPLEGNLTEDDIYWGTKLACLEMIKSGTVAFNDMYFFMERAADAVEEMGMKATLSYGFIDLGDEEKRQSEIEKTEDLVDYLKGKKNISAALGPHSPYTVSREGLEWVTEYAEKEDISVHFHLAETEEEIKDFRKEHDESITEYLDDIGILNERMTAAHCVWLSSDDIELLGERGVTVSHNPSSNMKLGVGKPMPYGAMIENGVRVTLGTDGCASNNNLDMIEEIKIAALQQKVFGEPTLMPAEEAYEMITKKGSEALGTGGGLIKEGMAADLVAIDRGVQGVPTHNFVSDLIYSLNGSCVNDVVIDGKVVMRDRSIEGEDEIIKNACERARELVAKVKS
ncbi:MAG: amidohydrolase [Thermoplasmata archaeon]